MHQASFFYLPLTKTHTMRMLFFIAATALLSCGHNSSKEKKEPVKEDTTKKTVDTAKINPVVKVEEPPYATPDEGVVNEALSTKFGTKWHVVNDKEAKWIKDAFEYFIVPKRKELPNYPYITKGDFNGDGKADMAAVVTDSTRSSYQVAIILGPDNIKFWDEDIMVDAAITTIAKSEVISIPNEENEKIKKIKMKVDGINIEYFERASFVVYQDKSSFKRIQTGD